ncbi:MAG: fibronectin type III domain-containing protein [Deltaproteobacteria bacterium]
MKTRRTGLVIFAMTVLLAAACGRKTLPVPPEMVRPAPISDLHAQLSEKGVTLIWTAPEQSASGSTLPAIEGFEIYRAVVPQNKYCPGCPIPYGPPIKFSGNSPQPGETIRYHEPVLRPGHRYFFKVRTRYSWFLASPDSNVVSFSWDVLPAAPTNLSITSGDQELTLSWQPPRKLVDGTLITFPLQYQVYRGQAGKGLAPYGHPVAKSEIIDREVQNGQTYYYQVRAQRQVHDTLISGLASKTVAGTPRDLTPPAPPRDLTAIKTPQGVRLVWPASPEPDLAGYRIYRQVGSGTSKLIGEVMAPTTFFVDEKPPKSGRVYYTVTAFDTAKPANESPPSRKAEVIF